MDRTRSSHICSEMVISSYTHNIAFDSARYFLPEKNCVKTKRSKYIICDVFQWSLTEACRSRRTFGNVNVETIVQICVREYIQSTKIFYSYCYNEVKIRSLSALHPRKSLDVHSVKLSAVNDEQVYIGEITAISSVTSRHSIFRLVPLKDILAYISFAQILAISVAELIRAHLRTCG